MNPLTSLDELIWKQFEKVTQYAHKSYGWDKYDCAQTTDTVAGVSLFGYGIYTMQAGLNSLYQQGPTSHSTAFLTIGTICTITGMILPSQCKKMNRDYKEKELREIVRTGASKAPHYNSIRPLSLIIYTYITCNGLATKTTSNYDTALNLAILTGGISYISQIATYYFYSQLLTPPSTKKPFWKTTYESIRNKLKPKPQLEPAAEPTSQYATIESLIP